MFWVGVGKGFGVGAGWVGVWKGFGVGAGRMFRGRGRERVRVDAGVVVERG
jgi:hypothetical protein